MLGDKDYMGDSGDQSDFDNIQFMSSVVDHPCMNLIGCSNATLSHYHVHGVASDSSECMNNILMLNGM